MENIRKLAEKYLTEAIEIRRTIHKYPELSFKETETAKLIRMYLEGLGISYKAYSNTGTVGVIGKGEKCIALRADIDALPIQEETGLPFSSENDGIMHACGHDLHTAMLLVSARILKENESELDGKVMLIFQLAEESLPGGASIMIGEGILEEYKPQMIFGQHINPGSSTGTIEISDGPIMASADELYWTIKGKSSHAAQPHLGKDPILAASEMVVHLQNIISKSRNPFEPSVLSITSFHGGTATNIIPEVVNLKGTLRTFNEDWRKQALSIIHKQSIEIAHLHGCDCSFKPIIGYPPLVNSKKTTDLVWNTATDLFGEQSVLRFEKKMWAEDFAYYLKEVPGTFWFIGVKPLNVDNMPALHNSRISPDENAMEIGIALFCQTAFNALNSI